jgi:CheY-like chemotaxis protein
MQNLKKPSIAIVDDDAIYRKILCFIARKHNIHVAFEAENGADCIQQIKENKELPDLVILDIEMPVMNGYETARLLKANWPTIKILGHSSIIDSHASAMIIENGADKFLSKTQGNAVLEETLKQILQH